MASSGPGPGRPEEFLCSIVSAIISQQVQRARGGEEPRRVGASWSSSFPSPIAIENERTTCEGLASARGSGWVLGLAEFPCGIASYVAPGPHGGARGSPRARALVRPAPADHRPTSRRPRFLGAALRRPAGRGRDRTATGVPERERYDGFARWSPWESTVLGAREPSTVPCVV